MLPFLAHAGAYEVKGKAGEYNVQVSIDKNPPAREDNKITVVIKDKSSKPVTDAQLQVQHFMPSLPGRPPMMEYTATAKPIGDHYQTQIDLPMAGEWTVVIKIIRSGQTSSMRFTFIVK